MNAKEAKALAYGYKTTQYRATISSLKAQLDSAIELAIKNHNLYTTINIGEDVDPEVLGGLIRVLNKLGYRTKLGKTTGVYGPGVLRLPQTTLTLFWDV